MKWKWWRTKHREKRRETKRERKKYLYMDDLWRMKRIPVRLYTQVHQQHFPCRIHCMCNVYMYVYGNFVGQHICYNKSHQQNLSNTRSKSISSSSSPYFITYNIDVLHALSYITVFKFGMPKIFRQPEREVNLWNIAKR